MGAATSRQPPQTEGVTEHDLLRQYAADGRIKARSGMPVAGSPVPPQAAGLQGQLGKVPVTSNVQAGVLGPHNQHNPYDTDLTRGEDAEDPEGVPISSSEGQAVGEGLVEVDRHDASDNAGSPPLQRAPGVEHKTTQGSTVLRDHGAAE